MNAASDANIRLGIQLLLIAIEKAPQLAAMIERGVSKVDLDALAAADDAERARLQAAIVGASETTPQPQ
jgi:hypothetical protein